MDGSLRVPEMRLTRNRALLSISLIRLGKWIRGVGRDTGGKPLIGRSKNAYRYPTCVIYQYIILFDKSFIIRLNSFFTIKKRPSTIRASNVSITLSRIFGTYIPNQVWFHQNFSTSRYKKNLKKITHIKDVNIFIHINNTGKLLTN